jgi:colanic acid biosynthesis glycosyl transferase WcaI
MKILIMGQHYAPEEVSGAVLATEISRDLVAAGHSVTFLTAAPSYPQKRVFRGYSNRLISKEVLDKVRIIRVWSFISPNKSLPVRIINYSTFSLFALLGLLASDRPDVIYCYSPPLPLGLSAWILSRVWRVPWIFRVEDIYPDAAIAAGVLRNKLAIRFFSAIERFLYKKASHISVISDGFRSNLQKKNVLAAKISVEPVWSDPDVVRPQAKDNNFRAQNGLNGKFVVMYAGNIGQTSALDEVLSAAEILLKDPEIRFVIIGEGIHKAELMKDVQLRGLDNVKFLPFQPRENYAEMMAAPDISLVTINSNSSSYSLPGKTFNIMASGRPLLAISPEDSELAQLVRSAGCGINVPPNEPAAVVATILELKSNADLLNEMGLKGRAVLEREFSRKNCFIRYEAMIRSLVK